MSDSKAFTWKQPVQAVLFDLDGTLADTAGDLGAALNTLRIAKGLEPLPLATLRPHASAGARGLIGVGLDIHPGDPEFDTLRLAFLDAYAQCLADSTCLFEGMADLLAELEAANMPWGIVTNKPHRFTLPVMAGLGLLDRAATIISGDSAAHAKPHPLPLLTACEQAGINPATTLYVGDDLRDIEAARAANMPSAVAGWGYLGGSTPVGKWGADIISAHPLELWSAIQAERP